MVYVMCALTKIGGMKTALKFDRMWLFQHRPPSYIVKLGI